MNSDEPPGGPGRSWGRRRKRGLNGRVRPEVFVCGGFFRFAGFDSNPVRLSQKRNLARFPLSPSLKNQPIIIIFLMQTDIFLKSVTPWTEHFAYRSPMKFGGRVVTDVTILNVKVEVESRSGLTGTGYGSMTMGNAWAWISSTLSNDQTLRAMVEMGTKICEVAAAYPEAGHPMEICHAVAQSYEKTAQGVMESQGLAGLGVFPKLAQLVAASPLEAAIFDAYGKMLRMDSFNLLSGDFMNYDLSHYLNEDFRGEFLDRYTLREPKEWLPLYHLVGGLDPLTDADIPQRLNDGLPETLGEWIEADGLTHLKIKLNGENLEQDVARTVAVDAVAAEAQARRGCTHWVYSADFNEKCYGEDYVIDWLKLVTERAPQAIGRLQYVEQPTNRDLKRKPVIEMFRAAQIRPVVIDESLTDFDALLLSRKRGYSGVALKACKGHHEALLMGAAAQKYEMFLCVQDLTCPGASFLHSASLAAHIPAVQAIEGNGRQYCPSANERFVPLYPDVFKVQNGLIHTGRLCQPGLGFQVFD